MLNVNRLLPVLCCFTEDILRNVKLMTEAEADEIRLRKIRHSKEFKNVKLFS